MMKFQSTPVPTYSLEDIHQLLLVLEQIKNLSLRSQQTEHITVLIEQITRLIGSRNFPVQLATEHQQQVQTILESLTPEERVSLDREIGHPLVEVAVLSREELQQLLSSLEAIVTLNLRPQQNQLIAFTIQQLEPMLAQRRSEFILKTEQALQIQAIINSLTPEEEERLHCAIFSSDISYRLTMTELQDLVSILRQLKEAPNYAELAQITGTLLPELEALQTQGKTEVELQGIQAAQLQAVLQQLMPA